MLIELEIPYNSEEALEVAEEVMGFIQREARAASVSLADERGTFPSFKGSVYDKEGAPKVRNATATTIAPTGTLSIIAGCSSGIEPIFAVAFVRNVMDNDELVEVNPLFKGIATREGFYSDELMKKIAQKGSVQGIEEIPEKWRRIFITAHDITPDWHVRVQAAFQKYTDNAVSKTVNFPNSATKEEVEKVYLQAYELGCKGVTIYRDGSRSEQVLNIGKVNHAEEKTFAVIDESLLTPRARPSVIAGSTRKMTTGCGNLYVTINEDEHGLFEVFTQMGKAGGCSSSQAEAISRLISLSLRAGLDPKAIVKQLHGVRCPNPGWEKGGMILSCSDAIAKAMERYLAEKKTPVGKKAAKLSSGYGENIAGFCPDCGGSLDHEGGCAVCRECGFSKCG
jgi:ribonucleoside-diphosphate reductase alpha chain